MKVSFNEFIDSITAGDSDRLIPLQENMVSKRELIGSFEEVLPSEVADELRKLEKNESSSSSVHSYPNDLYVSKEKLLKSIEEYLP